MTEHPNRQGLDLDTRALSEVIYALNIARRHVIAYPPGHPVIKAAADKLLGMLPGLLEFRDEITIGIARDTLMVGGQALDNTNPVYRDFANSLFNAQVASLTLTRDVSETDICRFFEILRYKADEMADRGGLHRILSLSGLQGIRAQGVDFGAFHATEVDAVHAPKTRLVEEETAVLWKTFVNGLVSGTLDPDGEKMAPDAQLDPKLLAELMNSEEGGGGRNVVRNYEEAITSFLREADRKDLKSRACQQTLGRLGDLVSRLKPELRRRFLNSTLLSCSGRQEVAAEFLGHLPQAQILEAMEQVDVDRLEIPQALMDILGKLARERGNGADVSRVSGQRVRSAEETASLLSQLFNADQSERFVPEDYQDALAVLAAAERLPGLDSKQVEALLETLEGHTVERHFCNVMLDLLDQGVQAETAKAIGRNLEELLVFFLETGDFPSLISVYDHLTRHARHVDKLRQTPDKSALKFFSDPEVVNQVIDGLETWGKTRHAAIKSLIKRVGSPFAEPLLERLADEPSMSQRRLLMECLQAVGTGARPAIEARLHDRRWFFVRNLVILLRGMEDPDVLKPLGRLIGYANPKVQFEVMRTFLHFSDPRADRYLLKELESDDPGVLLNAARLAANSRSAEVARKLSGVLNRNLLKEKDENVKGAVIKALAEIGLPEALPELGRFLHSRSLIQFVLGQNDLKIEAVKSLARYKDTAAADLAEEVYRKASGDLARAAGQVCLQMRGKLPWT